MEENIMCTSIALKTENFYFGRNLDLDYEFGQRVVVTPRNYPFHFREAGSLTEHYALIGMAAVADGYLLYAEAANEKGLCMAGLNFPDNAYYPEEASEGKDNVSPFEFIPWILGGCATVSDAETLLANIHLIAIPFHPQMPLTPLHWHIADRERSITVEAMKDGIHIHDNPVGVLTNNPPFDFHMTNLRQYLKLTADYPESSFGGEVKLSPFGYGFGGIGLPGDTSPVSRFVRAVFNKANSVWGRDEESSVTQFFHLLDSVAMVNGSVITSSGKPERTLYSCCINADKGIFYYKTYQNNQLTAIDIHHEDLDAHAVVEFPLVTKQQVAWEN